ncbi:hypothetical protein HanIR_Chr15g0777961 [Helianthus annuus]|nr:hypothetical protein HanIR_Chr15g0777961 [Helianthus annuus]
MFGSIDWQSCLVSMLTDPLYKHRLVTSRNSHNLRKTIRPAIPSLLFLHDTLSTF